MSTLTNPVTVDFGNGRTVTVVPFQLLQWKHALRLEAAGMRMSRGSVSAHVKRAWGLKRSLRVADVAGIVAKVEADVRAALGIE